MNNGLKKGIGNGYSFIGLNNGIGNGMRGGDGINPRMLDPFALDSIYKPIMYWTADGTNNTGDNTAISQIRNLIGSTTMVYNSDPLYLKKAFLDRAGLQFDSNDTVYTNSDILTGGKECTIMMVANIDTTSTYNLCWKVDSTIQDTAGDFTLEAIGGNRVRSTLVGYGNNTYSIYDSFNPAVEYQSFLVTAKYRIGRGDGSGNIIYNQPAHQLYINGRLEMKLVSDDLQSRGEVFAATRAYFGANSSLTAGGGGQTGCAIIFDRWLNESEQFMIENYFRWYFGMQF